jgi:hypothetical protein
MENGSILTRLKKYAGAKIGAKIDLCSWTTDELELRQRQETRRIERRASALLRGIIISEKERKGKSWLMGEGSSLREIGYNLCDNKLSTCPQRRQS